LPRCDANPRRRENLEAARRAIGEAARAEGKLCVLPELFSNRYPGQFDDPARFLGNVPEPSAWIDEFRALARRYASSLVVPFFETTDGPNGFNSLVVLDERGLVRGRYRKTHIPNGEGYREGRYVRPGDRGYTVVPVARIRLGGATCWDRWFPEVSRILALRGAQLRVYPNAIGSEVADTTFDSGADWELVMRAQPIANRVFVAAVNRVGSEERIRLYGSSFVADPWGRVLVASRRSPEVRWADLALNEIDRARAFFGFFETRRPDTYGGLLTRQAPRKPVRTSTR
jgi:N-carbamoylputrescine amidase